ncbi:sulfite exporter TauE/SafE family protein [Limibacter armeniacum]|uniref:sulfite exporter TauE/SafE family protein n=1 Tax=Limibacter armeniacum TaxID=466084 RepID=UPI002FE5C6A4
METQELLLILTLFSAGLFAGIINTLAGGGSVFTLSAMIFAGIPANIANATNRVGVLLQGMVSVKKFHDKKLLETSEWPYLIPITLGALAGSWFAVDIDEEVLEKVIGGIMVILLLVTIFKVKPTLDESPKSKSLIKQVFAYLMLFVSGFYGGFIQAGVGILLLVTLSVTTNWSILQANSFKLLAVLVFTIPALAIFIYNDLINWYYALILSLGQMLGAYLASVFGTTHPKAGIWVKRLLVVVIIFTIIKTFLF